MHLNHNADNGLGSTFTHGTVNARFGGAHRDGVVNLHWWVDGTTELRSAKRKCGTYRKAQRKLIQWLKGYNV